MQSVYKDQVVVWESHVASRRMQYDLLGREVHVLVTSTPGDAHAVHETVHVVVLEDADLVPFVNKSPIHLGTNDEMLLDLSTFTLTFEKPFRAVHLGKSSLQVASAFAWLHSYSLPIMIVTPV